MEPYKLKNIANSCNASLSQNVDDIEVTAICTDTRQLTPGCLFVALKGDRFDGHDYAGEAFAKGAVAMLVESEIPAPENLTQLKVRDTRKGLGEIAASYRNQFELPICAVAGSNGKTTTKELIARVLS